MFRHLFPILLIMACNESELRRNDTARAARPASEEFNQISFDRKNHEFFYGNPGQQLTQNFTQPMLPLDLLIVIDNSGSMKEEQENLSSKMAPLLSAIDKVDWQISVVTTDEVTFGDCFRTLIRRGEPNAEEKFAAAVRAGSNGHAEEHGIRNAYLGLRGECPGQSPWLRQDSKLSILVVSDEDDCSQGVCRSGQNWSDILTDYVKTIRPDSDVRFYGLIYEPGTEESCGAKGGLNVGLTYKDLVDHYTGRTGSICDQDYTETLEAISEDIANLLQSRIPLDKAPDDNKVTVRINGQEINDFSIQEQHVSFSKIPESGSNVELTYWHGKNGDISKDFAIEAIPAEGSLQVKVNGELIPNEGLNIDEQNKRVMILKELSSGAKVEIAYIVPRELIREWTISPKAKESSIKVTIEEKPFDTEISFEKETGLVTLNPAPPEGVTFSIDYDQI